MKTPLSALAPILAAASVLLSGCTGGHPITSASEHWTGNSVQHSMSRALLSYDNERDGDYVEFQDAQKRAIGLTVRRHVFNSNPDNPFQPVQKTYYRPRRLFSPFTDFTDYVGSPVHAIVAYDTPRGQEEFQEGWRRTHADWYAPGQYSASYMRSSIGMEPNQK